MDYQISVNAGARTFTGQEGETLLQALTRQGLFIPTACGGQGKCGFCRLKIPANPPQPSEAEIRLLKEDELAAGLRLACQIVINGNLAVTVPEAYYSIGEYQVKITKKINLTKDILLLGCQAVNPRFIRTEAGSWMQWVIPPCEGESEPYLRSFSLASDPENRRNLEFIIRRTRCGKGTAWIFDQAKVGDIVTLRGPNGDFRLHATPKSAIFIAGGSGLSAIRSILLDMHTRKIGKSSRLFFGAVSKRDLYLLAEMRSLENDLPDFKFIPALSAPLPEDNWDGETGLITEVVDRYYSDCSAMEAYLCGSHGMIDACIKVLKNKGMPDQSIYFDKFT